MSRNSTPVLNDQQSGPKGSTQQKTRPLISVADLPKTSFPTVPIPDNRYLPLTEHGTRRSRNAAGNPANHIRGILGEFAFADLFGIPDRVDTNIYDHGDPGFDLRYQGYTIDVKTAGPRINNPRLMVDERTDVVADFYVLTQEVGSRHYQILGYAPRCLVETAPIKEFSTYHANRVRVVDQDQLFPITRSTARKAARSP